MCDNQRQTITACITDLEKKLGAALFIRSTKYVQLTEAGRAFLKASEEILEKYELTVREICNMGANFSRALKIGFLGSAFNQHFSQWIPGFRQAFPEVKVSLQIYSPTQFRHAFENDMFDIGFARKLELGSFKAIHYKKLCDDHLMIAVHKNNSLAQKEAISLHELSDLPFIIVEYSRSPNFYNKVMQVCSSRSYTPKISHLADSPSSILQLINADAGVAILPSSNSYLNFPHIRYLTIDDRGFSKKLNSLDDPRSLNVEAGALWKKSNENPNIKLFMNYIINPALKE